MMPIGPGELIGGIEAGGTKFRCAIGTSQGELLDSVTIPTTTPDATFRTVAGYFRSHRLGPAVERLGIASFGPLDLARTSSSFGRITNTPKPGWRGVDIAGRLRDALDAKQVALDTDVNAACLAEWMWGAGRDLETLAYVTVGTGIGAGVVIGGHCLHGLVHPEFGHIRVPHSLAADPFKGSCPYHGNCLEGLASGRALEERWGEPPTTFSDDHEAWALETEYIAAGLATLAFVLSPQRIVLGGGIAQRLSLDAVRARLSQILGGYLRSPLLGEDLRTFLVRPTLGEDAGVMGAIALVLRSAGRAALASTPETADSV